MTTDHLVSCGNGHDNLTVCPTCSGTGHVEAGAPGAGPWIPKKLGAQTAGTGDPHCVACQGSGLLQAHPSSCTGSKTG